MTKRYLVPAAKHRVTEEIKRSQFITTIVQVNQMREIDMALREIRGEFPDATHHCWAYLIGAPGTSTQVGMSDDGEPHGTAGRPMLNVVLHSGIGDILAIVTRYYGGTNLGTGGLVRAYSGGVQLALASLPVIERIDYCAITLVIDYPYMPIFQQILHRYAGQVEEQAFADEVTINAKLPSDNLTAFRQGLVDATRGQVVFGD